MKNVKNPDPNAVTFIPLNNLASNLASSFNNHCNIAPLDSHTQKLDINWFKDSLFHMVKSGLTKEEFIDLYDEAVVENIMKS